jgi:hypothetical protein
MVFEERSTIRDTGLGGSCGRGYQYLLCNCSVDRTLSVDPKTLVLINAADLSPRTSIGRNTQENI